MEKQPLNNKMETAAFLTKLANDIQSHIKQIELMFEKHAEQLPEPMRGRFKSELADLRAGVASGKVDQSAVIERIKAIFEDAPTDEPK